MAVPLENNMFEKKCISLCFVKKVALTQCGLVMTQGIADRDQS